MKTYRLWAVVLMMLVCVFGLLVLCGCETVKGLGRDIEKCDLWMRDHMW